MKTEALSEEMLCNVSIVIFAGLAKISYDYYVDRVNDISILFSCLFT